VALAVRALDGERSDGSGGAAGGALDGAFEGSSVGGDAALGDRYSAPGWVGSPWQLASVAPATTAAAAFKTMRRSIVTARI
jgi:hypothetical protein